MNNQQDKDLQQLIAHRTDHFYQPLKTYRIFAQKCFSITIIYTFKGAVPVSEIINADWIEIGIVAITIRFS